MRIVGRGAGTTISLTVLAAMLLSMLAGCTPAEGRMDIAPAPSPLPPASPSVTTPGQPVHQVAVPDLDRLNQELKAMLAEAEGNYGIYLLDLQSQKSISINADTLFPAASTVKLPLVLYVMNQVAHGNSSLDEPLTYTDDDWEDGTGLLQAAVEGDTFTVRELVDLSIQYSDNIAANLLMRRFGADRVGRYADRLGADATRIEPGAMATTPTDMARIVYAIATSDRAAPSELREYLLDLLSNTAFSDRIRAGVPPEVGVAHKIGTLPNVVNDVALVSGEHPFILSVFSTDVAEEEGVAVIQAVAETTYRFLNGRQ